MKFINDMSESGKQKLEYFLNKNLKNKVYDLPTYIDDVIKEVTQNNDDTRYEIDSFDTKSGLPETIYFDESDFDWEEFF